jgi:hypothetical protein
VGLISSQQIPAQVGDSPTILYVVGILQNMAFRALTDLRDILPAYPLRRKCCVLLVVH